MWDVETSLSPLFVVWVVMPTRIFSFCLRGVYVQYTRRLSLPSTSPDHAISQINQIALTALYHSKGSHLYLW